MSDATLPLAGRVAFVTGGSRSIGESIALTLAARGADVVVTDSGGGAAERVAEAIRGLGRRALALSFDVADSAASVSLRYVRTRSPRISAASPCFGRPCPTASTFP